MKKKKIKKNQKNKKIYLTFNLVGTTGFIGLDLRICLGFACFASKDSTYLLKIDSFKPLEKEAKICFFVLHPQQTTSQNDQKPFLRP